MSAEPLLAGLADDRLLEISSSEGRILVTFNARHFLPLAQHWESRGAVHSGLIVLVGIAHHEYGLILNRLAGILADRRLSTGPA